MYHYFCSLNKNLFSKISYFKIQLSFIASSLGITETAFMHSHADLIR